MTRDEIKKIFPDATDEQITSILNSQHNDIEAAKKSVSASVSDDELKKLREKAKAYDDAEKAKMTAEEQYRALVKQAEADRAEAAKIRSRIKAESEFIKAGLTEAEYKDLLDDVIGEDDEKTIAKVSRFTKLLKEKTDAAVKTATENLSKTSMQPKTGGEEGTQGSAETDAAVALAKELASGGKVKGAANPFDYYK